MQIRIFLILSIVLKTCVALSNPCRKGINGNQFHAHPESNSKYITCGQWGQMYIFDCGQGLIWDPIKKACEFEFFQNFADSSNRSNEFDFQQIKFRNSDGHSQKLLALIEKNDNDFKIKNKLKIVTKCSMAQCPESLICAEASNCETCNPLCFPPGNFNFSSGVSLSCLDITCPSNSACLVDSADNLLKCSTIEKAPEKEFDVALSNSPDGFKSKDFLLSSSKNKNLDNSSSITEIMNENKSKMENQLSNSNFIIRRCSMVKCPVGLVCAEATNCITCSPLCFPPNQFDLTKAIRPSCESVSCPDQLKCFTDFKENNMKCII